MSDFILRLQVVISDHMLTLQTCKEEGR